ncbi:helix-turn-helix domain-containing protein [Myroides pelagicus]|uniref:winged helix-turn-helix transcriptional regulator n=1 Tax=Myroides pelagicus TaxID=270914 RepID=UPI002DBFD45A|nr:helix-turn-helix domain-containing protein [Myroides pelagicus]MEC4114734.1 helix-turn-helix domain-containing protein [Myroides pelagicus]
MRKETSTNFSNENTLKEYCAAHRVLMQISGRWKMSILFALTERELRYHEFIEVLPNLSERILTKQLSELQKDNLIRKEKDKTASVYWLTSKGKDFITIIKSFQSLGDL